MNGGFIATIFAVFALLATFLFGRKTGAVKEGEKLKVEIEAYTEKIKETEAKAESAEKVAELAKGVTSAVVDAERKRNDNSVASISDIRDSLSEQSALDIAKQQAEIAKEFMR